MRNWKGPGWFADLEAASADQSRSCGAHEARSSSLPQWEPGRQQKVRGSLHFTVIYQYMLVKLSPPEPHTLPPCRCTRFQTSSDLPWRSLWSPQQSSAERRTPFTTARSDLHHVAHDILTRHERSHTSALWLHPAHILNNKSKAAAAAPAATTAVARRLGQHRWDMRSYTPFSCHRGSSCSLLKLLIFGQIPSHIQPTYCAPAWTLGTLNLNMYGDSCQPSDSAWSCRRASCHPHLRAPPSACRTAEPSHIKTDASA